jgi:hypothetical protein
MSQRIDLSTQQRRNNLLFKARKSSSVRKSQQNKIFFKTKNSDNKNSFKNLNMQMQSKQLSADNPIIRVTTAPSPSYVTQQ